MQQSDFEIPTDGTAASLIPPTSKEALLARVVGALQSGDYQTAGGLLGEASERFPEEALFHKLSGKQRRLADRFERVYSLLKETKEALEDDSFVRAVGAFREAANLSRGYSDLENASFAVAIDGAEELGARNWRIAQSILEDAQRLNGNLVLPERLWAEIRAAERDESIGNVLAETAMAKPAELDQARTRLLQTIERYPDDQALAGRLKSIEATIEQRDKFELRHRQLSKITEVRNSLQRLEEISEVDSVVARGEGLAENYSSDPEFGSIVADLRDQAARAHKAAAALAEDRIEECLEECAWVLSRMRHHQLFLKLKARAEERELAMVDDYSNTVARVKELLAEGKFEEAAQICGRASSRLPQFADLQELSREIDRRKAERERLNGQQSYKTAHPVERGEAHLKDRQFRQAEQAFVSALEAHPGDAKVSRQVEQALFGFAQSVVASDVNSAGAAVECAARLLPDRPVPPALAEALREQRQRANVERDRWASLRYLDTLKARISAARSRRELASVRSEIERASFPSNHPDVAQARSELTATVDERASEMRSKRPAWLPYATAVAAIFLLAWGGFTIFKGPDGSLPAPSPAGAQQQVHDTPPATPAVGSQQTQPPADARSLAMAQPLPAPASPAPLPAMAAEPSGAVISSVPKSSPDDLAWRALGPNASAETLQRFADKYPASPHTREALDRGEHLDWHTVDQNDPDSLRSFLARHPGGVFASQAQEDLKHALDARETLAEAADWRALDRNNRASIEDFLRKHPSGQHATGANGVLADLEQKAKANALLATDDLAWKRAGTSDEPALQAYLRDFPNGRHRDDANAALSSLHHPQADSAAVLGVINRLATAWNSKDIDTILAIQRNLNRRSVRAELSQARQIFMRINPASPPKIEGKQAVVLCRRQASEVFIDGTRKEHPEALISYVMEKSGDAWTITETR